MNLLSSVTRHDILNQLSVLLGYLEVSAESVTDPVFSDTIARSLRAAGAIKQQILFTRDYQDVGVNAPQWQNLVATWQNAAASAGQSPSTLSRSPLAEDRRKSSFSLLHDRSCVDLSLYADPLFGKVFSNLIENVVKHGENATMVRLFSHPSPDGVIVVCEDDGSGVPASLKETIFQRGYGRNTGYGLFLAREILSITGLSIREIGEEGKGGRFEILVPHGSFRFTGENRSEPAGL